MRFHVSFRIPFLPAGLLLAVAACTDEADLGSRGVNGDDGARGGYAKTVAALCSERPDHPLNWVRSSTGTQEVVMVPAPSGHCASVSACLDRPALDPTVASKAVACLERETDKNAERACPERVVREASATRPLVTQAQTACTNKLGTECKASDADCRNLAVASDATLETLLLCFDKPCADVSDCTRALIEDAAECVDELF